MGPRSSGVVSSWLAKLTLHNIDSGSEEAGLVQDRHSYNENKQTYKRESVTEN